MKTTTVGPVKKTAAIVMTSVLIAFGQNLKGQDIKIDNKIENSPNSRQYNTVIVNSGEMTSGPKRSSFDELNSEPKVVIIKSHVHPKPQPAPLKNNDTVNVRLIDDGKAKADTVTAKPAEIPVIKSITDVPDWIKFALGAAAAAIMTAVGALWASRRRREERQPQPPAQPRPGTTNVTMGPDGQTTVNATGPTNVTVGPNGNVNVQQPAGTINVNRPAPQPNTEQPNAGTETAGPAEAAQ